MDRERKRNNANFANGHFSSENRPYIDPKNYAKRFTVDADGLPLRSATAELLEAVRSAPRVNGRLPAGGRIMGSNFKSS